MLTINKLKYTWGFLNCQGEIFFDYPKEGLRGVRVKMSDAVLRRGAYSILEKAR